jgi:hypothetical protein
VVPIGPPPALTHAEEAANLAACPRTYRETLRVIYRHASRSGRLFAGLEALMAETELSKRRFYEHRAYLVAAGYLVAQGGGHRGRTAAYVLTTPPERAEVLEALEAAGRKRCPHCGTVDPDHAPRDCPARPIAPRLPGVG